MNTVLVQIALSQYGLKEVAGSGDNLEIIQMAKECGFPDYVHDEIAWCSLLLNWVAWKGGFQRTGSLAARSWLSIGNIVTSPEMGDVVIFWRISPQSGYGHVGLYIGKRNGLIYVLGGNQDNMVQIEAFSPEKILGFRRLSLA